MNLAENRIHVEEPQQQLHISYSQLRTYLTCPQRYLYQYVQGVEWERRSAALPFGKAIHKSVEGFYRTLQHTGKWLEADKLVSLFNLTLEQEILGSQVEIEFKDGEDLETLKRQGADLLKVFLDEVKPQKITAVEIPFSVKIPDVANGDFLPIRLEGIFDLVEADSDDTYLVCELKTSSQRYSSVKLKYDLQSTVYSFAMAQMGFATSENSTLVRYDVLLKQKKPAMERYFVSRTTEDHKRLVQLLNQVLRAIEHRVFYRLNDWHCGECPFAKCCLGDV
jgi:putative RecB family exonuclease